MAALEKRTREEADNSLQSPPERAGKQRAALYCRLSEEDRDKQAEGEDSRSIQNQKSMLLQYALRQGWEIYGLYSDDDYAGADRRRPEFNRLLEDARQRRFDIVLCKTQSRFTRELELVEKYIHGLFPLWGIRFVSIVDNADTANKGNKKARQINGLVNEWYLEDMSENIKSVLNSRRQSGCHIGSFALYGYEKDPDRKGHLIVDPEAAVTVQEVFQLFVSGYGKTAIARRLNEKGIPNPTEYKRRKGLRYRQPQGKDSGLWSYSAVAHMLVNEIYIGNMVQGRYGSISYKTKQNRPRPREQWYVVEHTHEPIIDRELWDRAQERLARRTRPFKGGTVGLFAGMVRCAGCGRTLRMARSHGNDYLQCSSRYVCREACEGAFISVRLLERAVLSELLSLTESLLDPEALAQSLSDLPECSLAASGQAYAKRRPSLRRERDEFRRKAKEYELMLRRLYPDKVRGVIDEGEYLKYREEFTKERDRYTALAKKREEQLKTLCSPEQSPKKKEDGAGTEASRTFYRSCLHPERLDRGTLELMVNFILVGKKDQRTGKIPVKICWNF